MGYFDEDEEKFSKLFLETGNVESAENVFNIKDQTSDT
jgi:hypothetical protein